jgi:hypothetical protein
MAKRRHSVRRHKRVKTRNITRASFKRGGDNTTDESGQPKPYVPFYNPETGKQTIQNAKFLNPATVTDNLATVTTKTQNTAQKFPGIFEQLDAKDAEKVFNNDPLNRAAAIADFNRLTEEYKNAIGGLKRRKTFKRKTSRRKSRRSK